MPVHPHTSPGWTQQSGAFYTNVVTDPSNQFQVAIVYNSGDNTVSYSRDFGATWTPSTGITGNATTISSHQQYVLVGVNGTPSYLYYSIDYGANFTAITTSPTSNWTIVGISSAASYLLACDYTAGVGSIYFSTNGGISWSTVYSESDVIFTSGAWSLNDGMNYMYMVGYRTAVPYTSQLYISTDQGSTWTPSPISSSNLNSVACDQSGQYVVVSAYQDGVYRSTDYGAHWFKTSAPSSAPSGPVMGPIVSDVSGNQLMVMDTLNYAVYASSDAGGSWVLQTTTGSDAAADYLGLSMSPDGSYRYAAFLGVGTYLSVVPAWQSINFSNQAYNPFVYTACSSSSHYMVAVGSTQYGNAKCIVYSADYGLTWTLSDADASGDSIYTCLAATPSGQYVVAGYNNGVGGIVYSTNYGVNFTNVTTGLNITPSAIAISADGQYFYAMVANGSGQLYLGSAFGYAVAQQIGVPGMYWNSIASNSTGTVVYATAQDDYAPYYLYSANFATPYVYLPLNGSTIDVMANSTVTPTGSIGYVTGNVSPYAVNLANTVGGAAANYLIGTDSASSNVTVQFWFNPQNVSSVYQYIYSMHNQSIAVFLSNDNRINCVFPTNGGQSVITTSYATTNNTWYYVSLTFQTNDVCSFYVDNALVGTIVNSGGFGSFSENGLYCLGTYDNANGNCFTGYIDDFKIFHSAGNYGAWSLVPHVASSPLLPLSVASDSTGQVVTVTAGTDGIYQSTDGGSTWALKDALTAAAITIRPAQSGLSGDTWTSNGVNWTASASSIANSSWYSWYAFDNSASATNGWASQGAGYTASGNTSSTFTTILEVGSIQGEYLQIQSSIPLVMSSYQFAVSVNGPEPLPKTYYIVGSNDGVNWFPIQYGSGAAETSTPASTIVPGSIVVNSASTQPFGSSTITTTIYPTTTTAYLYFRLIVLSCYGTVGQPAIGEWYINAAPSSATIQPQLSGLVSDSWSTHGVDWTASASSVNGAWHTYKAFNTVIGDAWLSSNGPSPYNSDGSVITGVAGSTVVLGGIGLLHGEWLQIESSAPKVLSRFAFGQGPNPWPYVCAPATYYIVGSTDGTSWYPIQSGTFSLSNVTGVGNAITINYTGTQTLSGGMTGSVATTTYATTAQAYTYFRLIGTSIMNYAGGGSTYMEIGEWYMDFLGNTDQGRQVPFVSLPFTTSVVDVTGHSTVTPDGNMSYVAGQVGTFALNLSNTAGATPDNYVQGTFAYVPDFTVDCRFNLQSIPTSGVSCIFTMGTPSQTFLQVFYCQNANLYDVNYFTGFVMFGYDVSTAPFVIGTTSVYTGQWNQFRLVYSETGTMYAYLNGQLFGTYPGTALLSTITMYSLGSPCHAAAQAVNAFYSDLRIYTEVLSPPTGRSLTMVASDSIGANLVAGDGMYVYRSADSGASWATQIIDGEPSFETTIVSLSMDHSGTYAFVYYTDESSFMSQRSTGLSSAWTITNGNYYPVMTFSANNQYQSAINVLDSFNINGHTFSAYSTDSGATWTDGTNLGGRVLSIAADVTGQYVVALVEIDVSNEPSIFRSTDYGATWAVLSASPAYFNTGVNSIACDQTGQYLYVAAYAGHIFMSSNGGATWTDSPFGYYMYSVICSHSGQYVFAILNGYVVVASSNHGLTWNTPVGVSDYGIAQLACDWSGQYLLAACYNDGVYRSADYGQTWSQLSLPYNTSIGSGPSYKNIACNSTGRRILAMDLNNATVYLSLDYGATWALQYTPGFTYDNFMGVSVSPDGTRYSAGFDAPGTFFLTAGSPDLESVPCFLEGTPILCQVDGVEQYMRVEMIRPGTLVKTSMNGFQPVALIGYREIYNTGAANKDNLYLCTKEKYPELRGDITITGCHSILVDRITEDERLQIIATLDRIFITDNKYRLPACVDSRAVAVSTKGAFTVWHFALENAESDRYNYGVYANGLLVESSSIRHMKGRNYHLVESKI